MPLKSIQLTLSNDSSISVRSSPGHPPVLQNCTCSGPSGNLLLEGGSTTVKLQCEDAAHGGSAFLTYFLGDFKKTLVLWLCMVPEAGPEIKFNIFDEYPKLDHDVLKKVAQGGIMLETVGFGKEILWQFKDNEGQMHEISMVVDIVSTGHQSEAQLNIREPNKPSVDISQQINVLYKLTATALGTRLFDRVHEDMSICSLISAGVDGFDTSTDYDSIYNSTDKAEGRASWEFIRGVVWNDDPECDFFRDYANQNASFRPVGGDFIKHMRDPTHRSITWRSHNGDLQFLHAMASKEGEEATVTQSRILEWVKLMYRLSVGDGILDTDRIDSTWLKDFFNDYTKPKGSDTLRTLLVGSTPAFKADIQRRALGSCFHVIQDSYAVGHCRRQLLNPDAMIDVHYARHLHYAVPYPEVRQKIKIKGFRKEKPGRFSDIKTFHCYAGQDHTKHGRYDSIPNREKLVPSDPESFYCIVGALSAEGTPGALEVCSDLAKAWVNKWTWEPRVEKTMADTFHLAEDVTASDTQVDEFWW